MNTLEQELTIAIERFWPCQRRSNTVALTNDEFNLKVERIMSMLTIQTDEMRELVVARLSQQWVRLPDFDFVKPGYRRTYPIAKETDDRRTSAFDDMILAAQRSARRDGYQMFRKNESKSLRWRQVR